MPAIVYTSPHMLLELKKDDFSDIDKFAFIVEDQPENIYYIKLTDGKIVQYDDGTANPPTDTTDTQNTPGSTNTDKTTPQDTTKTPDTQQNTPDSTNTDKTPQDAQDTAEPPDTSEDPKLKSEDALNQLVNEGIPDTADQLSKNPKNSAPRIALIVLALIILVAAIPITVIITSAKAKKIKK